MKNSPGDYRADVDGLRAVAVLSVMLFHISSTVLPGGFVGVDIFFVISGFLITRNILQDLAKGRFSLAEFYRRRIKRIAPPMLVIVFVTVLAAHSLMLPEDSQTTAKSAVWSLSSLANVYFWKEQDTGYFAADSRQVPLLHLWSLGVEEQFYIIFPLLLLLTYRPGRAKLIFLSASAISLASFTLGNILFGRDASFAYYMLPTRAGELLLGALVALVIINKVPDRMITPMAVSGLLLLASALFLISEKQPFPGWRAMVPTIGTALLVIAGNRGNRVSRMLASRGLVEVGLMSYSAYLWHWPLLAFFRYGYGEPNFVGGVILFMVTLLLARMSYLYVEVPARRSQAPFWQTFSRQFLLPAAALGTVALALIYGGRLSIPLHSAKYRENLAQIRTRTQPAYFFNYVCQRQKITREDIEDEQCLVGANSSDAASAILWGDSNAAHYIGLLGSFARQSGFRFRNVEIGSCPPINGDPKEFVETRRETDCRESLNLVHQAVNDFRVVIISASWPSYQAKSQNFLQVFFDTVKSLTRRGKRVILLGKAPVISGYDRRCQEKALSYPFLECFHASVPLSEDVANINASLRRFAESTPNVEYFEVTPYLCPKGDCRAFDTDGEPLYYDQNHLTLAASWKLGNQIVHSDGVPAPFAKIATWAKVEAAF
jgi:peptidoglycan/LPS O-acetylase OafA/YrhL